ncbi:hypothetical protein [Thiobacter aerophilum]|uniref:Methyl-accepting chemotaxis protein n=1 Tax=Thiobacter aerophilum TaxID=3121275 RepID=A0ABV0EGB3_9BURK
MLRLVLQLGLLAAGIGLAASNLLDNQTIQTLTSSIRDFAATLRQSGLPGGKEAASGIDKAADAAQSAAPALATTGQARDTAAPEEQTAPKKAFYNTLPDECYWDKLIDPATGKVSCALPSRAARASAK